MSVNRGFISDTLEGGQEVEGAGQPPVSAQVCEENVTSEAHKQQHVQPTSNTTVTTADKTNSLSVKGEEIRPENGAKDITRGQKDKPSGKREVQDVSLVQKHATINQEGPSFENSYGDQQEETWTKNVGLINKAFDGSDLPLTNQEITQNLDTNLTAPVDASSINLDIGDEPHSVEREPNEHDKKVNAKDGRDNESRISSADTSVLSSDDVTSYDFNHEVDYIPETGFSVAPYKSPYVPNEIPPNDNAKSDKSNRRGQLNEGKENQPVSVKAEDMNNLPPVEDTAESKKKLLENADLENEPTEDDEQSPILSHKEKEIDKIEKDTKLSKQGLLIDSSQSDKSKGAVDVNSNKKDEDMQNVIIKDTKSSDKAQLDTIIPVGDDEKRKNEQLYENITDEELAKVGHGRDSKEYDRKSKEHKDDKTMDKPTAVVIPMITKDGIELDNLDDENANKRISVNNVINTDRETDGDDEANTPNSRAERAKFAENNNERPGSGKSDGFKEVDLSDGITPGPDRRSKKHTLDVERGMLIFIV